VPGVLGETFRLLAGHLHLFTLLVLTVWLPGHVALNYIEFFGPASDPTLPSLRLAFLLQACFDPLVVAALISALARIKVGLPAPYAETLLEGLRAWPRLVLVRFVIYTALALPIGLALALGAGPGAGRLLGGLVGLVVGVVATILVMRVAVVDAVVVLEGGTVRTAWSRAAALTRGRRRAIFGTLVLIFAGLIAVVMGLGAVLRAVPELNHFVVRVLVDCVLSVAQSVFPIALFLFYWRGRG
jgi:hypothetical protein